jgi:adenosylmethionine-8-amino-7-oxononanoate aminotransferase
MEYGYPKGHVFYRKLARDYPLVTHGDGIYLYDKNGKQYIDGSGGALVVSIGHGRKEIFQKMTEQMSRVGYVHGSQFTTASIEEYVMPLERFCQKDWRKFTPFRGSESSSCHHLGGSTLESVNRSGGGGRPLARLRNTGALSRPNLMRRPYLPLLIDFPHFPPPYCYRCPYGLTFPECELECARALENMIQLEGPETISAVILEPIIGATIGAVVPPDGYLGIIRKTCDRFGILLIDDEVMTGMGRTGRWFAVDHWAVSPDIMVLGKGMSGGYFPLSAMITRREFVDRLKEKTGGFVHGHTFSHHPVACAVGFEVLQYMKEYQLVERSSSRGAYLLKRLEELRVFPFVGDVRGKGLMAAIEFVKNQKTKEPFPRGAKFTERVIDLAFDNGLVLYPGTGFVDGVNGDMVMLGPPLTIEENQIDEIIEILKNASGSWRRNIVVPSRVEIPKCWEIGEVDYQCGHYRISDHQATNSTYPHHTGRDRPVRDRSLEGRGLHPSHSCEGSKDGAGHPGPFHFQRSCGSN